MMTLSSLFLFACLALLTAAQNQELYVRSHSLQAPFIDADLNNRYWEFGGSTVVSTNQYVRLTPDRQSKKGWLWSKLPFNYQNWMVEFEFKVEGQGAKVFGDGFAFWVTKERAEIGPVFGSRDFFTGLGIFFDTYPNTRHKFSFPYINAMVGDGHLKYSNDDDNAKNSMAGCEAQFRKSPHTTRARAKYVLGTLYFYLDVKGKNTWDECFVIEGLKLDGPHYLGFSAMTGDVADNHDIIRVTSYMIAVPPKEQQEYLEKARVFGAPQISPGAESANTKTASVKPMATLINPEKYEKVGTHSEGISGLTVFLVLVVMAFLLGVGFVVYKSQATKRSKRF